jgi:hypothetical protein
VSAWRRSARRPGSRTARCTPISARRKNWRWPPSPTGWRRPAPACAASAEGLPGLSRFLDGFLSPAGRDDYAASCPVAASASEIGRQDRALSARFSEGYLEMVRAFERGMGPGDDARARAMTVVAALVGAQAVARGAAKGDPALSNRCCAPPAR